MQSPKTKEFVVFRIVLCMMSSASNCSERLINHPDICTIVAPVAHVQWNLDLTKCQGTGPIGSLYRGFVISKTSL